MANKIKHPLLFGMFSLIQMANNIQEAQDRINRQKQQDHLATLRARKLEVDIVHREAQTAKLLADTDHNSKVREGVSGKRYAVCVSCNTHFGERFIGGECSTCRSPDPLVETHLTI